MDVEKIVSTLQYAADCIRYAELIRKLPTCNECRNGARGCMYMPKADEPVRINCPHFASEEEG